MQPAQKPAILFVNYTPYGGGDTVVVARCASHLASRGYRIGILTPENRWLNEQSGMDAVKIMTITTARIDAFRSPFQYVAYVLSLIKTAFKIRGIIQHGSWDIVHVNTLPNLAGAFGAWVSGRPLVWHVHELVIQSRVGFSLLRGLPKLIASVIVCPSTAVRANFINKKTVVIPNVIPDDWASSKVPVEDIRQRHQIPSSSKIILWIGGVAPRKGLGCFLDALHKGEGRKDIVALIVAEPSVKYQSLYEDLQSKASQSPIRTIFAENVSDPRPYYHASDIVLQTSLMPEAFGLTVLEAMAFGKPVICTGMGGMDEFVRDRNNAQVIKAGDTDALWSAITYLLENKEYRENLSYQALITSAQYTASKILPALESVYTDVLKRSRKRNG